MLLVVDGRHATLVKTLDYQQCPVEVETPQEHAGPAP